MSQLEVITGDGYGVPVGVGALPVVTGGSVRTVAWNFFENVEGDWDTVSGTPTFDTTNGYVQLSPGAELRSRFTFRPPILVEFLACRTGAATADNMLLEAYLDTNNRFGFNITGSSSANATPVAVVNGRSYSGSSLSFELANGTFGSILAAYIAPEAVAWMYRNATWFDNRRAHRPVVSDTRYAPMRGHYRIRLLNQSGSTNNLRVAKVIVHELPQSPFSAGAGVDIPVVRTLSLSSVAAGGQSASSTTTVAPEHSMLQGYVYGDQPFTAYVECALDGSNYWVIGSASSIDLGSDVSGIGRYQAVVPACFLTAYRNVRVRVRNNGASAGNFTAALVFRRQ